MKSTHDALVDRNNGELVDSGYNTRVTELFGREWDSVFDGFSEGVRNTGDSVIVDMTGKTGSLFMFGIEINYDLSLRFNRTSGTWSVSGTHDGFPSYVVTVDGVMIYNHNQGSLSQLLGCCDAEVGP